MERVSGWTGWVATALAAGGMGVIVGRHSAPAAEVHAQEHSNSTMTCLVSVPKAWGEFKGGSAYGLAFQDVNGTLRFLQHPACGNISSYTENGPVDLELQRR